MSQRRILSEYADEIESWADVAEVPRVPYDQRVQGETLCLKTKDQLVNINTWTFKCEIVSLVIESVDVDISHSSELADRYRIVNAAARALGLDHVVVARATKALSRDAFRFSRMT